ncbi:hypothetical protein JCGZ_16998 [Jatropha curcas]|uniref:Fe2OG dioxygenase domain-containing protein n=1 Tax=Jatropha curcas TaxID=180498 RepID=A0A067K204_JATCU|nr:hypothetical protein JCGZ_16998 [Jatropha curcas]
MSSSFLDKVRETACQFFELPKEEKSKYCRSENEIEGYESDMIVSSNQVLDWSHRLILRVFPEDERRNDLWPDNPPYFRETLIEYSLKVKSVMDLLYKAMARSLNLKENSFSGQFGERALMHARFNFYPRCSRPDLVLGVKPHTDRSGITILLQDKQVEGLQILVDEKWVRVPVIPDALVVNLGDQMQIMSNGIFRSPMHRVVTISESLRLSVALFHEPEPEKEIGPVDSLMDDGKRAVGHRVESSFLDKVREITKRFFALPMEEKHKYDREANSLEGYGNDPNVSKKIIFNQSERILLKVAPENERRIERWPCNPTDFRVIVESKKERISVAAFHLPKYEVEIGPVQSLMDETRPQQYMRLKDYRGFYYDSIFQGIAPLDLVKLNP